MTNRNDGESDSQTDRRSGCDVYTTAEKEGSEKPLLPGLDAMSFMASRLGVHLLRLKPNLIFKSHF